MKLQDIRYKNIDEKSKLITDNLGNKIDNGVRELVVLLNYHKIGTTQSCWGHKNWGLPYPWVDIHKKYLGNILEIIEGMDIEIENLEETIRIQPKIKTLKKGREVFKGLKNKLKNKIMNRDTSWDDPQLSDGDFPSNQPKFRVGDKAIKVKGYKFPCTIVSVFQTVEGNVRVVGEMDEYGLLHIFNEEQLEKTN